MKIKQLFLLCFMIISLNCFCQQKTNPIFYGEMLVGYSNGSSKGMTGGATLNFEKNKNLFTYRYLELDQEKKDGDFFFIPIYIQVDRVKENALMYGRRYIEENMSLSYSAGISAINRDFLVDQSNAVLIYNNQKSIGFPFELNIKWFNYKKERYRIYELIPVGKPVGFANSIGFKFYGDISKTSFVGIGLTVGLGWHKNY